MHLTSRVFIWPTKIDQIGQCQPPEVATVVEVKMETTIIGAVIGLGFLKQIKTSAHQHTYFIFYM